jgi:flagellar motor switch/type III secretory pathway protein FliN
MFHAPAQPLTNLPRIEPAQSALQTKLLALLSSDDLIATGNQSLPPRCGPWLVTDAGLMLHFVRIAGQAAVIHADRLDTVATAIDACEGMLCAIETQLGVAIEPVALVAEPPADALIISLSSVSADHLVQLAFPNDIAGLTTISEAYAALAPTWSHVPVAYELCMMGPTLPVIDAAAIDAGDMLIIGSQSVAARIIWPLEGERADGVPVSEVNRSVSILGRFNMVSGDFTASDPVSINQDMNVMTNTSSASQDANNAAPGFAVPLSIRLPIRMASVGDLSSMRVGTTFSIGPVTQGLAVSLMVADREIAAGELVQVGDQFAVLIDHKPDLSAAHPPPAGETATEEDS